MNANDDDIRKLLADAENGVALDDQDFHEMLASTFRGKLKWMSILAYIYIVLFLGVAVFAGVKFFGAADVQMQIMYATIFTISMIIIMVVKLWLWLLMNRNAVKREIKRLELRLIQQQRT